MAFAVEISVERFDVFRNGRALILLELETIKFLTREVQETRDDVRDYVPVDLGTMRQSIDLSVMYQGAGVHRGRVFSNMDRQVIVNVVEFGRRAGARMPPPDALVGWLSRHGSSNPERDKWALARYISIHGTPARQPFKRAYDVAERRMGRRLVSFGESIATALGDA